MQLKDVMQSWVESVAPDTSLREAARKMNALGVRMLPVCDGKKMVGVLTLRDLTMRATSQGRDPVASKVCDVMTYEVICSFETQDVRQAERTMRGRRIPHLFVVDQGKHLRGVVSLADLERADAGRTHVSRQSPPRAQRVRGHKRKP